MAQVVGGSMDALGMLFERHRQPLFAFLARFLHDHALAEDVLAETFFRLYDRRRTFRFGCKFTTWLYTIAHHLAVDQVKNAARRDGLAGRLAAAAPAETGDDGAAALERAEYARAVRAAVDALPPEQRAVIVLRVYHEMSYREIAEITRSNEETVRVRAHRARLALKGLLAPVLEEEPCRR